MFNSSFKQINTTCLYRAPSYLNSLWSGCV